MSEHPEEQREPVVASAGAAEAHDDDDLGDPPGDPGGEGEPSDPGGAEGSGGGGDGGGIELDEVDVKDLLRGALAPPRTSDRKIAEGVQKKLRDASGGRFFADGWSTTPAPRATFLVTSLLMLLVVLLAWWLLTPSGVHLP